MVDLIFCYAVYNAEQTFRRSLESVKRFADRIVVVEGRFLENPHGGSTRNSTDKTVKIAREFTDEVIISGDLPQHEQRDLYLLESKGGDYFFIIDADEVLREMTQETKEDILSGNCVVHGVWIFRGGKPEQLCVRIFRQGFYTLHHCSGQCPLIDGKGRLMDGANYDVKVETSFWLDHI